MDPQEDKVEVTEDAAATATPEDASTAHGQSQDDYNKHNRYTEQDIDFERGNTRRARQDADAAQSAYDKAQDEIDALKTKLESKQEEKSSLEKMDPDYVDKTVQKNIQLLADANKELQTKITNLEQKAQSYEETASQRQADEAKTQTRERILGALDGEYGAEHRNNAVKMAQELVDTGKESQPKDVLDADRLMRKCYKKLATEKTAAKKTSTASDSGSGSVSHPSQSGIKEGSMDDVKAQMLSDDSWKEE